MNLPSSCCFWSIRMCIGRIVDVSPAMCIPSPVVFIGWGHRREYFSFVKVWSWLSLCAVEFLLVFCLVALHQNHPFAYYSRWRSSKFCSLRVLRAQLDLIFKCANTCRDLLDWVGAIHLKIDDAIKTSKWLHVQMHKKSNVQLKFFDNFLFQQQKTKTKIHFYPTWICSIYDEKTDD